MTTKDIPGDIRLIREYRDNKELNHIEIAHAMAEIFQGCAIHIIYLITHETDETISNKRINEVINLLKTLIGRFNKSVDDQLVQATYALTKLSNETGERRVKLRAPQVLQEMIGLREALLQKI